MWQRKDKASTLNPAAAISEVFAELFRKKGYLNFVCVPCLLLLVQGGFSSAPAFLVTGVVVAVVRAIYLLTCISKW